MRKLAAVVALTLATVLLAACYTSKVLLLDGNAGATPLAAGDYVQGSYRRNISYGQGGWYVMRNYGSDGALASGSRRLLLNRAYGLDSGSRTVYYYAVDDEDFDWVYGLLVVDGSAVYDVEADCDMTGAHRDIATSEGGRYYDNDDMGGECFFEDGAALKRALDRVYGSTALGSPYYRQ